MSHNNYPHPLRHFVPTLVPLKEGQCSLDSLFARKTN